MLHRRIPVLVCAVAAVVSFTCAATSFVHGPYCGAPDEGSITISWQSADPVPARVEYGPLSEFEASGRFTHSVDVPLPEDAPDTFHVVLDGLPLDSECVYRVVLLDGDAANISPMGFFCTEPPPGETVSFFVLADTQQQLEGVNRLELVADAIAADPLNVDFILHAGDVVESPSEYYWDDWFASFDDMLMRAPFIPVLGNHEKNHRSYYRTFELPPGEGRDDERWWALHWGDVVVVGLDTNVKSALDIAAQQDWAREHLAGPEPHKFVIFHHPVFSSDPYHGTGFFFDTIYHPIFVEMDVDIVFNGHSHHYEHIVRDGVTYMVIGGGGATPRQTTPEHIQGSDVSVEGHLFYVRVTAWNNGVDVETVSVAREIGSTDVVMDARVLDSFDMLLSGAPRRHRSCCSRSSSSSPCCRCRSRKSAFTTNRLRGIIHRFEASYEAASAHSVCAWPPALSCGRRGERTWGCGAASAGNVPPIGGEVRRGRSACCGADFAPVGW